MSESFPPSVDARAQPSRASNVSASSGYAFLVHSQQTLPHNLPPNVDNKPLARQKRRRTSPEDQAILEAEYSRNNRPDKTDRQDIVKRVALGDKEVQIWFQNRRQNDRRKSRPLLPYDRVPRSCLVGASDATSSGIENRQINEEDGNETGPQSDTPDTAQNCGQQEEEGDRISSSQDTVGSSSHQVDVSSQVSCETIPTATTSYTSQQAEAAEGSLPRTGYLANRRNASFVRSRSEVIAGKAIEHGLSATRIPRDRGLKKSSSLVRISLTSDGNAKVLTNDDSSPSPPRATPGIAAANTTRGSLCRSQSATGLNEVSTQTELEPFKDIAPRGAAGRSRDSRAWEFWCDSDARNALAEKADQDAGGSAAGAIGLIRSNSRNVLNSNANKRNAQLLNREPAKRLRSRTSSKSQLSRTASAIEQPREKDSTQVKGAAMYSGDVEIPNNESDKENREPGQRTHSSDENICKPTEQSQNRKSRRTLLTESSNIPSKGSNFGTNIAQEKARKVPSIHRDSRNKDPEDDPEIAEFMGASRKRSDGTNASGEDLDCVQGLLSLSQGNWR